MFSIHEAIATEHSLWFVVGGGSTDDAPCYACTAQHESMIKGSSYHVKWMDESLAGDVVAFALHSCPTLHARS